LADEGIQTGARDEQSEHAQDSICKRSAALSNVILSSFLQKLKDFGQMVWTDEGRQRDEHFVNP
jgi:hypothetical protein